MKTTWELHVEVTEEDIRDGVRKSCWSCPVALAFNRGVNYKFYATVADTVRLKHKEDQYVVWAADLPVEALRFISKFDDRDHGVMPFEFDVTLERQENQETTRSTS